MPANDLPVLERSRLDDLASELNSWDDALRFAARFLDLLPNRVLAISTAIEAGMAEAAHIALVSLAVSAEMIGAARLERDARLADEDVHSGHLAHARTTLQPLRDDADAVAEALRKLL